MDHHLGPNQHANWCVTWPFFDIVMGTCEPYVDTAREAEEQRKGARVTRRGVPSAAAIPVPS